MKKPDQRISSIGKSTRRDFLRGLGLAAGATTLLPGVSRSDAPAESDAAPAVDGLRETGRDFRDIQLKINGVTFNVNVEPRETLLDVLRYKLQLTGAKQVCDRGACGACNALMDGQAISTCMIAAVEAEGHDIQTIEGVAADPRYAALIHSFCEHDAAQCGYCIPGMVVGSASLLNRNPHPTRADIKEALSGHLCRCAAHTKIVEAVYAAAHGGGDA
jgi:aerobic-type carbon monoxide dehydrogenase small subunit (CoxS/CutS family)